MFIRAISSVLTVAAVVWGVSGSLAQAVAAEYRIDHAHSFVQFQTLHLGFSWLVGRFNQFDGSMTYDPEAGPEAQSIQFEVDMASIDSNHAERDRHLRGGRFLNVDEHPSATFVSTGFEGDRSGGVLSGDLTFLGTTRNISFDVALIGEGGDPWGGYRAGFEGQFALDPTEYNDGRRMGPVTGMVIVDIYIEAVRQ